MIRVSLETLRTLPIDSVLSSQGQADKKVKEAEEGLQEADSWMKSYEGKIYQMKY